MGMPRAFPTPLPFRVGQIITGAEVVGFLDQYGATLYTHGPITGYQAAPVGDRVDVRVISISFPTGKLAMALPDTGKEGRLTHEHMA